MDVFDVLLPAGLATFSIVVYLLVFRRKVPQRGYYKLRAWNYPIKYLWARYALDRWKKSQPQREPREEPNINQRDGWDSVNIRATAPDGTTLLLVIRKLCGRKPLAEVTVHVKLPDGSAYALPQHPDTAIGAWDRIDGGWSAGGLKILVLEPHLRLRILYNGLLTRSEDNVTQHVRMSFIWVAASQVARYPEDCSTELAADAIALEPWKDDSWPEMLAKWKDGSWLQFGAIQGRFTSYNTDGAIDKSVYLRMRGVYERSWALIGYQPFRRSVYIYAGATDGTLIVLRAVSYGVLSKGLSVISGWVRLPGYDMESVTGTDLTMADFCEHPTAIPNTYSINVSTKTRDMKVILRVNNDGGKLFSGVPYQQQFVYRTLAADIDGYVGAGILQLGYLPQVVKQPPYRLSPAPILKWTSAEETGEVGYCLPFEDRAATCTEYVGGKGASLALLASMQRDEGYSVPPGFCLTIHALNKYLELNPEIKEAIKEIEAANEKYEEADFKQKCEKASKLFLNTEIQGKLRNAILESLDDLRKKAVDLGDLRFAVRSSAVGEDSEVLSAAGQNETILGCVTDDDVLKAVQKCWGSMFAFTSAYYRRQNGQPCLCGGGVVIQVLVPADVAGVMFTRHPEAGDPARLLVTANYGLGESVVSGSVEPDTFIVRRDNDKLSIASTTIGSKTSRITVAGNTVGTETITEGERNVACLSSEDVLRLAKLGVVQEELWGAGRDIEWAFVGKNIFLLQARPITSLERWTEEELLHELDDPIMSDDEIISFGNSGEVLPHPMTALTNDLVKTALTVGIDSVMSKDPGAFDHSVITTHNRAALLLFNSVYRQVPKEIDINIRMIEMAVHGHEVADDSVLQTALHRRQPRWNDRLNMILLLIRTIMTSKRKMNSSIHASTVLTIGDGVEDPSQLFTAIEEKVPVLTKLSTNHSSTSTASTSSQFVAMTVLLEGRSEFSPELCNEIGALLSSGDVLSAEVPHSLAKLANSLEASGKYDEFRAQKPEHALQWLKKNLHDVYLDVCGFLDQHGHRAVMEFDLATKPWVLVPEEMMKVLQSLRAKPEQTQKTKTDDEIIESLKSVQKTSTKKVLRWVMPLCRRTIRHREGTKAHLILGIHKFRVAMLRLGKLMVKQWYLPNEDLVFFFRFRELKSYLQNRDPGLLRKAIQRQQLYPKWCKLNFPEISFGYLSPLCKEGVAYAAGDVTLHAASVCGGEVVARACVIKHLSEIAQLQQGDILITHATDIGWSPYFPLITGIVTELGGLISHGAVIAREYGLPCIVGAASATDIFRTGDIVRLSGTKGTLERVTIKDNTSNGHTN